MDINLLKSEEGQREEEGDGGERHYVLWGNMKFISQQYKTIYRNKINSKKNMTVTCSFVTKINRTS
jgi:hypothetical protein